MREKDKYTLSDPQTTLYLNLIVSKIYLVFLVIGNDRMEAVPSEQVGEKVELGSVMERKWISAVMSEVLPSFVPWSSSNEECTRQGEHYQKDLANLTLWAVQSRYFSLTSLYIRAVQPQAFK